MKANYILGITLIAAFLLIAAISCKHQSGGHMVSYIVDTKEQHLQFYWKNDSDQILGSIKNLKAFVESKGQQLLFAMNGGMYKRNQWPQGLYIEKGVIQTPLDTSIGEGNFYLKPNGVFYITQSGQPFICVTENFHLTEPVAYATQSGPLLLMDGQIHPAFQKDSRNLNIRNGVGILPDNKIVFAMSKAGISFYNFAQYFKDMGCTYALYLDGYVSKTYLPQESWIQTDGNFGVIIAVTTQ